MGETISVDLPDSLLREIAEFLPIKTVVRLSLLSRRFTGIWKSTRSLNFDHRSLNIKENYKPFSFGSEDEQEENETNDEPMRLARVVDHVITSHAAPILTCHISHYQQNCELDMPRWMGYLSQRGIQELILTCYGPPIKPWVAGHQMLFCDFPEGLFSCESLQVLKLNECGLGEAAAFVGAGNLTSLTLNAVILYDKMLSRILKNCPSLEILVVRRCSGLAHVKIRSASLKGLEIIQSDSAGAWYSVEVDIPAATTLVMDVLRCIDGFDVVAPNLRFLYAQRSMEEKGCDSRRRHSRNIDALAKCFGLYRTRSTNSLSESGHPLRQLQKIAVEVDLNNPREAIVVAFILRNCHYLQEVNIKAPSNSSGNQGGMDSPSQHQCLPYPASEFWKRQGFFDCVSYSLRTVKIKGITGQCLELEFAGYIIQQAVWLYKMEIQLGSSCTKEGTASTRRLLSLPRASLDALIFVD